MRYLRICGVMLTVGVFLYAAADAAAPTALTDEEWARFYKRHTGEWRAVPAKTTHPRRWLAPTAPYHPASMGYLPQPDGKHILYTAGGVGTKGGAMNIVDGREYPRWEKPGGGDPGRVTRVALDEFTVSNVVRDKSDGGITGRYTLVMSPDGDESVMVMINPGKDGDWTIDGVIHFEKISAK